MSNIIKEDNSKSKEGRVVILVRNMSSCPFYSSTRYYQNILKGIPVILDYHKSKEGRVVILVRNKSSGPVLHFCQVPSKYSKGYSSYRADKKSVSNKTKGENSKSKKARVVVLVCDTSSGPALHFYQVS